MLFGFSSTHVPKEVHRYFFHRLRLYSEAQSNQIMMNKVVDVTMREFAAPLIAGGEEMISCMDTEFVDVEESVYLPLPITGLQTMFNYALFLLAAAVSVLIA